MLLHFSLQYSYLYSKRTQLTYLYTKPNLPHQLRYRRSLCFVSPFYCQIPPSRPSPKLFWSKSIVFQQTANRFAVHLFSRRIVELANWPTATPSARDDDDDDDDITEFKPSRDVNHSTTDKWTPLRTFQLLADCFSDRYFHFMEYCSPVLLR